MVDRASRLEVWGFAHARSEAPGRKTHRRGSLGFVHEADKHAKSAVEFVQLSGTTSDCVAERSRGGFSLTICGRWLWTWSCELVSTRLNLVISDCVLERSQEGPHQVELSVDGALDLEVQTGMQALGERRGLIRAPALPRY